MTKIPDKLDKHRRSTWKPVVEDGDGSLSGSKFSGQPWLAKGQDHPLCPNCKEPLQLFLQLNLDQLPDRAPTAPQNWILVQLFYCTNEEFKCESECEAFTPFSKCVLAREVKLDGEAREDSTVPKGSFPAKTIV